MRCAGGALSWRGPTFPWLKPEYHWRGGLSGSSSGWDRLQIPRYTHQLGAPRSALHCSVQFSVFSIQKFFLKYEALKLY